jgi:cell cycle checkpoint control protein RAD9A
VLKQPLHTTIAVDTLEFGEFNVEEQLHIVISVKDFKAIIAHAGITNTIVKALYSNPANPMQLTYNDDEGLMSEFILMTIGEARGASAPPAPNASRASSNRPASRPPVEITASLRRPPGSDMPPPPVGVIPSIGRETPRNKSSRPSPPPPQATEDDSLFLPAADDDRRWDPVNYDEEEEEEMLLWDVGNKVSISIHMDMIY